MNTEQAKVIQGDELELCNLVLKILKCNSLWIMKQNGDFLNISVTDKAILQHYFDKKYYLGDPSLDSSINGNNSPLNITIGTDCSTFKNNGFFHELYKIFDVTEFVSVHAKIQEERYCFRFFTQGNRFVLMNNLINNMPIIKIFIFDLIAKFHTESSENQKPFRLSELQGP